MAFKTKVSKARFVVTGYSPEQMMQMGGRLLDEGIKPRIRQGHTVYDSPAEPLSESYARRKKRLGKQAVRDWTLTGRTLRSLKVLTASPNRSVLGFTDEETNKRAFINNRRDRQFGVSPSDKSKLGLIIQDLESPVKAQQVA